jgi:hypothetical protein
MHLCNLQVTGPLKRQRQSPNSPELAQTLNALACSLSESPCPSLMRRRLALPSLLPSPASETLSLIVCGGLHKHVRKVLQRGQRIAYQRAVRVAANSKNLQSHSRTGGKMVRDLRGDTCQAAVAYRAVESPFLDARHLQRKYGSAVRD